jgi:hypothetical protein
MFSADKPTSHAVKQIYKRVLGRDVGDIGDGRQSLVLCLQILHGSGMSFMPLQALHERELLCTVVLRIRGCVTFRALLTHCIDGLVIIGLFVINKKCLL